MVVILRGISGCGKTTYVANNFPTAKVVSADQFFYRSGNGNYAFDPKRLGEAHAECLRNFISAVKHGYDFQTIVVDNTSITVAEVAPYAAIALAYGHHLKIVTLVCDPVVAAKRNQHNVPEVAVRRMASRLDVEAKNFMPFWPHEVVVNK